MGRFGPVAARDWRSTERRKRSAAALAPLLGQPGAGLLGDPVGDAEPGRQGRDLQLEHERSGALRSVRGRNAAPLKGAAGCVGFGLRDRPAVQAQLNQARAHAAGRRVLEHGPDRRRFQALPEESVGRDVPRHQLRRVQVPSVVEAAPQAVPHILEVQSPGAEQVVARWDGKHIGRAARPDDPGPREGFLHDVTRMRSEEHTSELQSHSDLVCRLLLEKKKKKKQRHHQKKKKNTRQNKYREDTNTKTQTLNGYMRAETKYRYDGRSVVQLINTVIHMYT